MRAPALIAALLALFACGDALAPVSVGAVYQLRSINDEPLPWNPPSDDSAYLPMTVTEGWIKFLDGSIAQRHERLERWVTGVNGDSSLLVNDWTQTAAYDRLPGRIVLSYPPGPGGGAGADTLSLGPRESLVLHHTGYLSLGSTVRRFCISADC